MCDHASFEMNASARFMLMLHSKTMDNGYLRYWKQIKPVFNLKD